MTTTQEPNLAELASIARRVQRWTEERDRRIIEAVAAGVSQREVARTAGLSHTAVQYIVRRGAA